MPGQKRESEDKQSVRQLSRKNIKDEIDAEVSDNREIAIVTDDKHSGVAVYFPSVWFCTTCPQYPLGSIQLCKKKDGT